MTPRFALAVDPIFLDVLDLLDRISSNEASAPEEESNRIQNRFREAEAQVGEIHGWELAKYALAAWIDDVLIEATWEGRNWWENNLLEFAYFKTRDRATEFFLKGKEAAELSRRDFLEVFYVCVVLGFRGMYGLSECQFLADQLQLPIDLASWTKQTARSIQLGHGRAHIAETLRPAAGAPPLEGKFRLVGAALMGIMLAALVIIVGYFVLLAR